MIYRSQRCSQVLFCKPKSSPKFSSLHKSSLKTCSYNKHCIIPNCQTTLMWLAVVQRCSGQPLIGRSQVQFSICAPMCRRVFEQHTEPHIALGGWRQCSAAGLPSVCVSVHGWLYGTESTSPPFSFLPSILLFLKWIYSFALPSLTIIEWRKNWGAELSALILVFGATFFCK